MKLSNAVIVVLIALGVAFLAYSTYEGEAPAETFKASIGDSLPPEPEIPEPVRKVNITSTEGLDEELGAIMDEYAKIQDDFSRLEPEKTATGAGN